MLVFTIIFGRIARLPADGTAPYPLMFFAGILPWTFFDGVERGLQQSDQQREPDQQGLFPTAHRTHGDGGGGVRGLPYQLCHFSFAHGLVPISAGLADPGATCLRPVGIFCQRRSGPVDHGSQRQIPGFPLRHPLHRAVWAVRIAGRFQLERSAAAVAIVVFAQSNGGSH